MITPLLTLPLRSKRDVLLARQRARQVAGLLGFETAARLAVGARVFEIARDAYQRPGRRELVFQIDGGALQVFATGGREGDQAARGQTRPAASNRRAPAKMDPRGVERLLGRVLRFPSPTAGDDPHLNTPLPRGELSVEDVTWALRELARQTPLNVFEEIWQQNQEMLRLLPGLPAAVKEDQAAAA